MLNHITLAGRLTKDPELRRTGTGKAVTSFTLAVDRDGEGVDFIPCVAWEKTGEFVGSYFTKGKLALVSGRLQIRSYTDKSGNKRTASEVVCERVYFGEKKTETPASFDQILDDDEALPFA